MAHQRLYPRLNRRLHARAAQTHFILADRVGDRVVVARQHPLADQHREPALFLEQFRRQHGRLAGGGEQIQARLQAVGNAHVLAVAPEGRVVALGHMVVRDQEILDVDILRQHLVIIAPGDGRRDAALGEVGQKLGQPDLDQVDRGRFQRLQETRRQAQGDDVLVPHLAAVPCDEAQDLGILQRLAIQTPQQLADRLILADILVAEDIAVACAVLQRNAPLPSCFLRSRACERRCRCVTAVGQPCPFGRYGSGAIARQPGAPVLVTRLQGLFYQQAAEPRTVDKQVAGDEAAVLQRHRGEMTALRILVDLDDLAFLAHHPARLGIPPQEASVERRVEMEGVVELDRIAIRQPPHQALARRLGFQVETGIVVAAPQGQQALPEVGEGHAVGIDADGAERVEIGMSHPAPVDELDTQLETGIGLADELILVEAEQVIVHPDHRDGGFTDPDRADLFRFDQGDGVVLRTQDAREAGGRHPAGRTATDNDDVSDLSVHQA
ncbi:hypothetical protein ABI_30220 [Asticcacaulis biprosthecium C19]|uniref:Uncharacterized protein n=1 Tax=Asticcacaulis biprosthecium C19 TaxID=715226 RepID=F4QN14_9CAUL|nr:hypothetical protein ABI_30220 [Asticcacaulis biprosthecium C19]